MSNYLKYKKVITRKSHVCFGCGREFPAKTEMISAVVPDCGKLEAYYLCTTCDEITSKMRYDDEYGFGDLKEGAIELERTKNEKGKI